MFLSEIYLPFFSGILILAHKGLLTAYPCNADMANLFIIWARPNDGSILILRADSYTPSASFSLARSVSIAGTAAT
jgi:hypothetical protein